MIKNAYRFNGVQLYIDEMNKIFDKYEEKKKNNEDFYELTREYLEIEEEYRDFKKWIKKEVKREQKEAIKIYLSQTSSY